MIINVVTPDGNTAAVPVIPPGTQITCIDDLEVYIPDIKNNITENESGVTHIRANYAFSEHFDLMVDDTRMAMAGFIEIDVQQSSVTFKKFNQEVRVVSYTSGDTSSKFTNSRKTQEAYPNAAPLVDDSTIKIDTTFFGELYVPLDNKTIVVKDGKVQVGTLTGYASAADLATVSETATAAKTKAESLPTITMSASVPTTLANGAIHLTYS